MRLIDADAFERAVMFSDDADLQDVIYRLRDFPTADPVPWIPCTERLPETEDYVLCTTETKKGLRQVVKGYYMHDVKDWACGMNRNVLAWQPMPEPWNGKE